MAVTWAPRRASSTASVPSPQPISSTRFPVYIADQLQNEVLLKLLGDCPECAAAPARIDLRIEAGKRAGNR